MRAAVLGTITRKGSRPVMNDRCFRGDGYEIGRVAIFLKLAFNGSCCRLTFSLLRYWQVHATKIQFVLQLRLELRLAGRHIFRDDMGLLPHLRYKARLSDYPGEHGQDTPLA